MIGASHPFQQRGLNALDENGNEGCAFCGRPRDVHLESVTAATPGQAALQPGEVVYLYHWRFDRGEEFGLYRHAEDAEAMAAKRAGEGLSKVLSMAVLDRPQAIAAQQPHAADGVLLSDYLRERGRPGVAAMIEDAEREQPAPGLAAARDASDIEVAGIIVERNQLREVLAKIRQACERPGDVAGKTSGSGIINGRYLAEHLLRIIGKHPVEGK